ncbi:histone deacetylase complex subunit SAP18 isoform X1 [Callorhinus ursinus]|uniref:histone deacetylase complex subunit SAP18 isoform X1 n=1 Tax=Callorhinus ursinus TaxID=34884 RepID=UPI003CD0005B
MGSEKRWRWARRGGERGLCAEGGGVLLPGRFGGRGVSRGERSSGLAAAFFNFCPSFSSSRSQTCPLLLRVFTTNNGRHHRMDEFSRGNVPSSELQIYTWMDATLKELTSLVKEVYPEARKKGTHFNFAIVFTDPKRPGYRVKEIGSTMSGRKGTDDSMTLQSQKFQIGDYLDIAITPPNRAPPPSARLRPY